MRIESDLLADHLRAAAVEQTARRLAREGHDVEKSVRLDDTVVADLRAIRPGGKEKLYHIVLAGMGSAGRPEQASRVRAEAVARRAEYHLVLVRPPRDIEVEVVGIEDVLKQALIKHTPENLRDIAPKWEIEKVSDVEVARVQLVQGKSHVAGDSLVTILFPADDDDFPTELGTYPLKFDVVLDSQGALRSVTALEVDTSS